MEERLQKILSAWGVTSRRSAETLITAGRVTVNGMAAALGDKADPERDEICLDGKRLGEKPPGVYLMLNKPRGFVTTLHDEQGRKSVAELIEDCPERVYPVGRLDQYSEGLLLLTNDGQAAYRLAHPWHSVEKTYHVWVSGYENDAIYSLRRAIRLEDATVRADRAEVLSQEGKTAMLEIVIHEGRNRQIRRMCQAVGLTVTRLRRVSEGELQLGDLPAGAWRHLTQQELRYIHEL